MRQSLLVVVMFGLCVASTLSNGQAASAVANGVQPMQADSNFFRSLLATPQFARASHMSADAVAGIVQGRIPSVPQFSSSFTFQGTVFPYTMVGDRPQKSGTTEVDT